MNASSLASLSERVTALFGIEERDRFYAELTEIITAQLGLDYFAVLLIGNDGGLSVDYSFGSCRRDRYRDHHLQIEDTEFAVLRLPGAASGEEVAYLAGQLGRALYLHKVIEDQERRIGESLAHVDALRTMGELFGDFDCELVLNRILKFCLDLTEAELGAARLHREGSCVLEARWGLPGEVLEQLAALPADGPEELLDLGKLTEVPGDFRLGAALRINLSLQGENRAEFYFVSGKDLDLGAGRRQVLASCRQFATLALRKSLEHEEEIRQQRLNEQLEVARGIQARLLPESLPTLAGLDLAGRSLPAQYVGGDYYDAIKREDGSLLAIVADVSGKGVPAALRMSALRAMLRSGAFKADSPGEVLDKLNRVLVEDRMDASFVTACCLIFAPDGRHFRLASAGHDPVLLHLPGRKPHFVDPGGGLPLGLRADEEYDDTQLDLPPGSSLLVYTDGITDARGRGGRRFGSGRLADSFSRLESNSAGELLNSLISELDTFRDGLAWSDDLTLLAFRRSVGEDDGYQKA